MCADAAAVVLHSPDFRQSLSVYVDEVDKRASVFVNDRSLSEEPALITLTTPQVAELAIALAAIAGLTVCNPIPVGE